VTHQDAEFSALSRTEPTDRPGERGKRLRTRVVVLACAVVVIVAAVVFAVTRSPGPGVTRPPEPVRYLGVYERSAPGSYSGIEQFAKTIGQQPNLVSYYSSWLEPFQASFATSAARHGAVPIVQINPTDISLAAIAAGRYDAYLRTYAAAVRSYNQRIIMSFGHEMNGWWFSWGNRHVSPATFVAAWRHIVDVFRQQGASNVTWLWTINIIAPSGGIRAPGPWWPGRSYVNWVGIDGYYYKPSWTFASLFGPTIKKVRALTRDPILISETAAAPAAGKPEKIADLFAGLRSYGLLGFVWFDADQVYNWRVNTPAAKAAFRHADQAYEGTSASAGQPGSSQ
jgi:mannan endo-1,4-beta-mannosidase